MADHFEHLPGCTREQQIEQSRVTSRKGVHAVWRCLSCGADRSELVEPATVPPVGSEEWCRLWVEDPGALFAALPLDQRGDPTVNPLHPYASSWPPGREPGTPSLPPSDPAIDVSHYFIPTPEYRPNRRTP